ncbi:hypothetical protein AN958_08732 [Leucoagaricus sp. SymC.cos]|nr:hypothetical protein AN958_08732 [Leucoagaricus sp. SymC.cos]
MSDDSVEFGGFGPTTPAHSGVKPKPRPRPTATTTTPKPLTKQQKSNGVDQEAGPSKRANGNAGGRPAKRKKQMEEIVVESEDEEGVQVDGGGGSGGMVQEVDAKETRMMMEDIVASSDGDEMRAEVDKQLNGTGNGVGKTKSRTNGRTQQRGKPSSSSKQPQRSTKKSADVEVSEEEKQHVEEDDNVIHIDVQPSRETRAGKAAERSGVWRSKGQAKKPRKESAMDVDEVLDGQDEMVALVDKIGRPGVASGKPTGAGGASSRTKDAELARLNEMISRLENENRSLSTQMEELFRYEAKIRALEEVNQALTEQLVKKQPLAGIGRSSVLNFITREVADAEKQTLEKEIVKLKDELNQTNETLSMKDQEIGQMKQLEKELRFELKAEIDRANTLAKQAPRHPHPTPRSGLAAEDPKHREAIKLYEDLTNIIVLNIRSTPGADGKKDEWQFNCYYTHTNESDSVSPVTRSLSFSLRSYEQHDSEGHSSDWVQYLPTSLDEETEDFKQRLGFLNAPFQFERNQLALFLRTLYTTVEEIVKASEESDEGDREQDANGP